MTGPLPHPWLSTPEAMVVAHKAARFAERKIPAAAKVLGADELVSEAICILTECAIPIVRLQRHCGQCLGSLEDVRAGAKFCSKLCKHRNTMQRRRAGGKAPLPKSATSHKGSMWTWPIDSFEAYAVREVGLILCNYLRTRAGRGEVPSASSFENQTATVLNGGAEAREVIENYLLDNDVPFDPNATFDELARLALEVKAMKP